MSVLISDLFLPGMSAGISFGLGQGEHLAIFGDLGGEAVLLAKSIAGKTFVRGKIDIECVRKSSHSPLVTYVDSLFYWKNLSNTFDFYYQQRFNASESDDAVSAFRSVCDALPDSVEPKDITTLFERFGISHLIDSPLIQLSSGEQKKLQLIKAVLNPPGVLVLDHPFMGLDAGSRTTLDLMLSQLAADGATVIVVAEPDSVPVCITHFVKITQGMPVELKPFALFDFVDDQPVSESFNKSELHDFHPETQFDVVAMLRDVSVSYGSRVVLEKVNWTILQGEKWLLQGKNGSGKSTLLSLLYADHPQAFGNDMMLFDRKRGTGESIWDIKKHIGYVSADLHKYFDKSMTVFKAIASGFTDTMCVPKKLTPAQEKVVADWMTYFDLTDSGNHPLYSLSLGKQKWALLARALVKQPPLLILDEPCQGLDHAQVDLFLQTINRICTGNRVTLIYVSHYDNQIPSCIDHFFRL